MRIKTINESLLISNEQDENELINKMTLKVLQLIGRAHDDIMHAQDVVDGVSGIDELNQNSESIIEALKNFLEDLEASLGEMDYMGYDDPVEAFAKGNDLIDEE